MPLLRHRPRRALRRQRVQAAYFYTHALGFREIAYAGLETGMRDRVSHVLEQGRIRLVLTGALHAEQRRSPATSPSTATA